MRVPTQDTALAKTATARTLRTPQELPVSNRRAYIPETGSRV